MVSSLRLSETDGKVGKTKTTTEYKYDKHKVLSEKKIVETKGEGYSSKEESSILNKYDMKGNLIEMESKYSGSKSTIQYKYNSNNVIIEEVSFNGSCTDKPASRSVYLYHPDGTIKEMSYITYDYPSRTTTRYDERQFYVEEISIASSGSIHTVYQYEYWP